MCKFQDNYEKGFSRNDKEEFFAEVSDREANTKRFCAKSQDIQFFEGVLADGCFILKRLLKDGSVTSFEVEVAEEDREVWVDTIRFGSKLFVRFKDEFETIHTLPLSSIAKLSLNNRSTVSFSGELSMPEITKIALARMYEDLLHVKCVGKLTVISIYGKVQAIMSARYAPLEHDVLFQMASDKIHEKFGDGSVFSNALVNHCFSRCVWEVEKDFNERVTAGLAFIDSPTGYSGVIINPVIAIDGKGITFDNAWYSKHVKISPEDIDMGIDAVYADIDNNSKLLVQTAFIPVNYPVEYAKHAIEELNRLAGKMKTAKIVSDVEKQIMDSVNMLAFAAEDEKIKVWDLIEVFWSIPSAVAKSANHQELLEKTMSRILLLKHDELDVLDAK